ncbi:MAG: site-2 protease family protein [Candidatus Thermoplasmatota archaeon]
MENTILIIFLIIVLYLLLLLIVSRSKKLEKYNISVFGPLLIWKTKKGKNFIERIARYRNFFNIYGNFSLCVSIFFMFLLFFILLWQSTLVFRIPAESAPTPQMMLGIPGVNPLIPIGYGIIGLAVAIAIHELAHGVLAKVGNIEVKSQGLAFFIVPIGAFVEPDEEELKKADKKRRARIYAVGPATNIFFGIIFAAVFSWGFMGNIDVVEKGVLIHGVVEDYPAEQAGLKPWMLITKIEGKNITEPGIKNEKDFHRIMDSTKAGDNVTITYYFKGKHSKINATLSDKYEYYLNVEKKEEEGYKGKGFLGVSTISPHNLKNTLAHPLDTSSFESFTSKILFYVALPIYGLTPFQEPLTELYEPKFFIPHEIFWFFANVFYWLFWLNIIIGATNFLPAVPLDGGYIFKDSVDAILKKLNVEKREILLKWTIVSMSLLILILVILPMVVPRIIGFF